MAGQPSSDDESAMVKQAQATHSPDGRHEVDVKPVIHIVEEILNQLIARRIKGHQEKQEQETLNPAASLADLHIPDSLAFVIRKISHELSSGGGDEHGSTMVLLKYLSSYAWHEKVVLTLAAFAVFYGEFWLALDQLNSGNTLAKSVALLKKQSCIVENSTSLRPQLDALNKLVKAALNVTMCLVEFKELQASEHISQDTPPMSNFSARIPVDAYWVLRSIVACASQIACLMGMRNESVSSATEESKISHLAHKLNISENLKTQLAQCKEYIADTRDEKSVYNQIHLPTLVNGTTKSRASLEELRTKHVLLFISDLDLSQEEILVLEQIYRDARVRVDIHYEMVWIPVVDKATWNDLNRQKFEYLQSMMAWYSVRDPLIIEPSVIKYIKEVWNFTKRPIVVAIDPQGKLSSPNALHMIWSWGNLAFPFTREKEESMWKQEIWSLEFFVDGIDPMVLDWIEQGKTICLYGGEDVEWIETFTKTARTVATVARIPLEMLYMGKSNAKQPMQKMINKFANRKFSYYLPDVTAIWFFWARLESMLHSKLNLGKTVENDQIMSEVMSFLGFDGGDQGWAMFWKGAYEVTRAKGDKALTALRDFDKWKANCESVGFVAALNDYLQQLHAPHHCNRLFLPRSVGKVVEKLVCAECGRQMEKYAMYRCCVD